MSNIRERFCKICGEYFVGVTNECYCSDECRAEGDRIANEDKQLQKKLKRRREKAPPNKLDEIMKECNRLGITYSEYKKKQLLDKVGRMEVVE